MNLFLKISAVLFLSFHIGFVFAQPDSLKSELASAKTKSDSLTLFHQLSEYYVYNDASLADEYGRAFLLLAEASGDSSQIVVAKLQYGKILAFAGQLEAAKESILQVIDYSFKYNVEMSKLCNYLGNIYSSLGKEDSSLWLYEKAFSLETDSLGKGIIQSNIAAIHNDQGDVMLALEEYLQAVKFLTGHPDDDKFLATTYLNIGALKANLGEINSSVEYYKLAIRSADRADTKYWSGFASINLASKFLFNLYQYDSAYHYLNKSREIFSKMDDPKMKALLWMTLCEYFQKVDQNDSVDYYLNKAIEVEEFLTNSDDYLLLQNNKILFYYSSGKIDLAMDIAAQFTDSLLQTVPSEYRVKFYDNLAHLYRGVGQLEKAFVYTDKFMNLNDSLINLSAKNKMSELEIAFETEKKDNEIASLSQQSKIQALEIRQRNLMLAGLGVVLLILVGGGVFYYQWRKLRFQQSVAGLEQRMLRLQMNPHFIFNALAAIQSYIIQSNTRESISYLAKFGKLMRQILEHSREEFITIEEEVDMLQSYLEIQQLRFNNSFEFEIIIDERLAASETRIPPMFAQPFVENAIEHGLSGKNADGLVSILFLPHGKNIQVMVEDNGEGLGVSSGVSHKKHKSLATQITKERLQLLSKQLHDVFELEVKNREGAVGTVTQLIIPSV